MDLHADIQIYGQTNQSVRVALRLKSLQSVTFYNSNDRSAFLWQTDQPNDQQQTDMKVHRGVTLLIIMITWLKSAGRDRKVCQEENKAYQDILPIAKVSTWESQTCRQHWNNTFGSSATNAPCSCAKILPAAKTVQFTALKQFAVRRMPIVLSLLLSFHYCCCQQVLQKQCMCRRSNQQHRKEDDQSWFADELVSFQNCCKVTLFFSILTFANFLKGVQKFVHIDISLSKIHFVDILYVCNMFTT